MKKWLVKSVSGLALVGVAAALVVGTALAAGEGPEGPQGRAPFRRLSEATGLEPEEVLAELQAGKTPADILSENGVNPDDFVAEGLADLEAHLDEAVAEGKIDQARADEILAAAEERLPTLLNRTFEFDGQGPRHPRLVRGLVRQMAEATGLEPEEVLAELQAGKTAADILSEHGVNSDDFVADVLAKLEARLDEAVAEGNIDQARADEILAGVEEQLPERLNQTPNFEGRGDGPPSGGPGGPGGHHDGLSAPAPGGGPPEEGGGFLSGLIEKLPFFGEE